MTRRVVKALDLVADADLIQAYEGWHKAGSVWPEVIRHIREEGVLDMEIWRVADRLVMIVDVADDYPRDIATPPRIAEWEALMDQFQLRLSAAAPGEKWAAMKRIFALGDQTP